MQTGTTPERSQQKREKERYTGEGVANKISNDKVNGGKKEEETGMDGKDGGGHALKLLRRLALTTCHHLLQRGGRDPRRAYILTRKGWKRP